MGRTCRHRSLVSLRRVAIAILSLAPVTAVVVIEQGSCGGPLSAGANGLARIVLPTGLSEYTTSFRAFDRRSLDVLVAADFTTGGYAFFVECIEILHRAGVSMSEVPIDFVDRTHGSSKIPKSQIFMSVEALISMGIRRRKMPSM